MFPGTDFPLVVHHFPLVLYITDVVPINVLYILQVYNFFAVCELIVPVLVILMLSKIIS